MRKTAVRFFLFAFACAVIATSQIQAQVVLLATGKLTSSRAGADKDLSGLNGTLENGVPANLLGGLGSAITYAGGEYIPSLAGSGTERSEL